jgi:hypothetical protein
LLKRGFAWKLILLLALPLTLSLSPVRDHRDPVKRVFDPLSESIDEAELRGHVTYLAQPALRGRRILSAGSDAARRYVTERFEAYGLVPWQSEESYEQPFPLGTNLIGVLPGSDPVLRDEFVVVCAHIDHLGRGKLGACDNAAGVAALLEAAEFFSASKDRPARSICFAVVDAEEIGLLGSFVFTRRDDYDPRRIAGVVNVDMLGRSFLDVMDQSIMVAGAEQYPETRAALEAAALREELRLLQVGLSLIPAQSDHVAFIAADAHNPSPPPILMFTCGYFQDYHTRRDTADKLDYATLARSARLIAETVRDLADAPEVELPRRLEGPDRTELATFKTIGEEILRRSDELAFTEENRTACQEWLSSAENLLAGANYTRVERRKLIQGLDALGPPARSLLNKTALKTFARGEDNPLQRMAGGMELVEYYRPALYTLYGSFVDDILKENPYHLYLLGMKDRPHYHTPCAGPDGIRMTPLEGDRYRLDTLIPTVNFFPNVGRFGRVGTGFSFAGSPNQWEGTRDELIDCCLLEWHSRVPNEAYEQMVRQAKWDRTPDDTKEYLLEQQKDPLIVSGWNDVCRRMLETVAGDSHGGTFEDWLSWRLEAKGKPDADAWMLGLLDSDNEVLFTKASECLIRTPSDSTRERLCRRAVAIVADGTRPARIRSRAAFAAAVRGDKDTLLALCQYVDDQTRIESKPVRAEAFQDHPLVLHGKRGETYPPIPAGITPARPPLGPVISNTIRIVLDKRVGQDRQALAKAVEELDKSLPADGPWLLPPNVFGSADQGSPYYFWSLYGED